MKLVSMRGYNWGKEGGETQPCPPTPHIYRKGKKKRSAIFLSLRKKSEKENRGGSSANRSGGREERKKRKSFQSHSSFVVGRTKGEEGMRPLAFDERPR